MAPPTTELSGNLLLIKDPSGTLITTVGGQTQLDWITAINIVYTALGDDYDFIGFFIDVPSGMPNTLGSAMSPVYNDVTGVGLNVFNGRGSFTPPSNKLLSWSWYGNSVFATGALDVSLTDLLHELAHQWLAHVNYKDSSGTMQTLLHQDWVWNPAQSPLHWGRWSEDRNSCMDYDEADWIDNGNGTFNRYQRDAGTPVDDAYFGYWELDQYIMGFLDAGSVPPIRIVQNPNPTIPSVQPPEGTTTGPFTPTPALLTIGVTDIQSEEGPRSPDALHSQRVFHEGFAIITKSTAAASANPIVAQCEGYRTAHTANFRRKTAGQAMVDTSLLRGNFSDLYVKDNDADTGDTTSSGVFWLSPDLWVRNANDGGSTHQDTIRGQDNWVYMRVRNKGRQNYDNATATAYIANFDSLVPSTQLLYPTNWNPAGLIGSASIATVPAATSAGDGTAVVSVLWPASQIPPAAGWHPCLLCEVTPMEITPTGLHHVFENKKLAQHNITIV